ncbi:MAG: hypothetical protein E3J72_08855 [Planctomycetota bacterium]|nr:MAG: hypothetical protein E3J72_08855 [Planctomycetota bacterium]
MKNGFALPLLLAVILFLTGCPPGMPPRSGDILSERDARITAYEAFLHEAGINLTPDVQVNVGGSSIVLDGYDNATGVGFFYESEIDKFSGDCLSDTDLQNIYDARNSGTIFIMYSDMIIGRGSTRQGAVGEGAAVLYDRVRRYIKALREDGYLP